MAKKNLCAMIEEDLHMKVCEERDKAGLTNSEYVTQLLTEYFTMKENGGANMARENGKERTLAFQISEELFQRITLTFSDLYPQNEKGEQISLKNGSNHRKPTGLGHKSVLDISARCGYNCTRTGGGHNVG